MKPFAISALLLAALSLPPVIPASAQTQNRTAPAGGAI